MASTSVALRDGRGIGRAGGVARAAPGPRNAAACASRPRRSSSACSARWRRRGRGVAVIDSIQTLWSETPAVGAGLGGAGARVRGAAHAPRQARRHRAVPRRPCHQGRRDRRAARARAHRRHRALLRGRSATPSFRLVRAAKNRFGAVNELGVFAMTEKGLRGVSNPSRLCSCPTMTSRFRAPASLATLEGTRPLLVEIQALVDPAHTPNARRLSVGLEANRLAMLLAVLHRHAGHRHLGAGRLRQRGRRRAHRRARGGSGGLLSPLCLRFTDKPIPSKVLAFRRDRPRRRSASCGTRTGAAQGGGEARLREGDRAEGEPAEGENRRPGNARGRAYRPGGSPVTRALRLSL